MGAGKYPRFSLYNSYKPDEQAKDERRYFYVDETGDPSFYGKRKKLIVGNEGCSRTFGLGFLRTVDPEPIRRRLTELRAEVAADRYLKDIPSMKKTLLAFHAKDDCAEVRQLVFRCLDDFDFSIQIVVARKLESIFTKKHGRSQDAFYNDLTSRLFERQLHLAHHNTIVFARRGNKAQQHALRTAVGAGVEAFRNKYPSAIETTVEVQTAYSAEDPLLQAADYALWAVQRAFERREMRYFDFIAPKVEMVWDIYDFASIKAGSPVIFSRKNPFHVDKISPLG